MKKLVLSMLSLGLIVGFGYAQNESDVSQTGDYNTANVTQNPTYNYSQVIQNNSEVGETGNTANINQTGLNKGVVEFRGSDLTLGSWVNQNGQNNTAGVTQLGSNSSTVLQDGSGMSAVVNQETVNAVGGEEGDEPNNSFVAQGGFENQAFVDQLGNGNDATIEQYTSTSYSKGQGSAARILQTGEDNTAYARSNGWWINDSYQQQDGTNNSAAVYQGVANDLTGYNYAEQIQSGQLKVATITQNGWRNTAIQNQSGETYYGAVASIDQQGGGFGIAGSNYAIQNQTQELVNGFENRATITQISDGTGGFGTIELIPNLARGGDHQAYQGNYASQTQTSWANTAVIYQEGNFNSATQVQTSNANGDFGAGYWGAYSTQVGSFNTVEQTQGEETYTQQNNLAIVEQYGDYNESYETQTGKRNITRTYQEGSLNISTVTQEGDWNTSDVTQIGNGADYNNSVVSQSGYGHVSNVFQNGAGNSSTVTQSGF